MECAREPWLSDQEYLQQFRQKVTGQRVPLSGGIDLTHRCNLRCVHCYLGDQESIAGKRDQELSTEQWCSILDEITEAGCLYLLITGGEPLLRKDFAQIYRYAKLKGMIVTVFSNGTLVTDNIVKLFEELPPQTVEISLYGATPETYERVTGIKGSYERCIHGIERLLDAGVKVGLKTILMTVNRHEYGAIRQMATDYGVPFRFDAAIFARFNGDTSPLQLRVPPQEAIEHENADVKITREWQQYYKRISGASLSDNLYTCGTGMTSFHVNAWGKLQPCLMVTGIQYDLLQGDFLTGWKTVIPKVRDKKMQRNNPCQGCETMPYCGYCPPMFALENDLKEQVLSYSCEMGKLRLQNIQASMNNQ